MRALNLRLMLPRIAAVALCGAMLSACASKDELMSLAPEVPADKLYNEGVGALNKGEYTDAAKKFEELDRQHPYSELSKRSMLLTAFAKYRKGDYEEAIQAAQRFVTLHPGSPDAAYAQYLIAQSYYNQVSDVTRDQAKTERALTALNEVVQRYPDSEYAPDAKKKLEVARDQLAGRDMEIGRYYLSRSNYVGAINRFKNVVTSYQTTRHVEEALYRLTEANLALGVVDEAQTAAAVLGHNYPDSPWYKDAFRLLKTGGFEPRENQGSWISRALRSVARL